MPLNNGKKYECWYIQEKSGQAWQRHATVSDSTKITTAQDISV